MILKGLCRITPITTVNPSEFTKTHIPRSCAEISVRRRPPEKVEGIITMRKEGKLIGDHIAGKLKMHKRTVSRNLIRAKLSRKKDKEDRDEEPLRLYEHEAPGDMIDLDIKKLWNFSEEGLKDCNASNPHKSANKATDSQCMHVATDDNSRYASASIMEYETAESVTKHLIEYAARGILY